MTVTPDMIPQNAAPPPAPADPPGFWDTASAAWRAETVRQGTHSYDVQIRDDLTQHVFDNLSAAGQAEFRRLTAGRNFGVEPLAHAKIAVDLASREVPRDPARWAGYPLDMAQWQAQIDARRQEDLAEAQALLDRPGGIVPEFLGSAARGFVDLPNLMMAPLGLEGSLTRMILSEAALNAAAEGLAVPGETRVARELGLPDPSLGWRMAEGALFGAGLAGFVGGAARYLSYRFGRRKDVRALAPAGVHPIDHEGQIDATAARLAGETPLSERLKADAAKGSGTTLSMSDFDFTLAGNASPRTNRVGYVYGKLLARGVEPHVAAGIVGNGMQEAGPSLNPGAVGDGGNAFGIWQWNGPRMRAYLEFARKAGAAPGDIDTQIDFLFHELETSEAPAWAQIRTARTADEAAVLFSNLFERPGTPHMSRRVAFAATVQDQYAKGIVPAWRGATVDPGTVPDFTTTRGYTGAGQISTGAGRTIDVEYIVVDASLLRRASGDLQPRDRSRATSDAWIAETAARLDPAQLMPSPNAATGTPIIGPDNVIESGNGRFGAIDRAYDAFPDRAAAYRKMIEDVTGQPIPEGIERPVLVARRKTELDDEGRRALVIEAQDSGVARMTPTEIARITARQMTTDLLSRLDPEAGLFDPANAGFVRSALGALPASERNAMFSPDDGGLNRAGKARLAEAMFARAWDAPDILTRFTETDGGELKTLLDALDQAAPSWAALKADIEAGRVRPDADIGPFVIEAMRLIAAARDLAARDGLVMGNALAELLDQPDLIEGALSPLTLALIRNKFWKNGKAASAAEIGDFLKTYAAEARRIATADNMFTVPTAEILRRIDPKVFGDLPDDLGAARAVITRSAASVAPPMPEEAFAKGSDSPEAVEADRAALEALRGDAPAPDLAGIEPEDYVRTWADAQPFDDLDGLYEAAARAQARLAREGERIADEMGIAFKDPGLKDRAEAAGKIDRKGYASARGLTDVSRAGFVVNRFDEGDALVARLAEAFDLIDEGWNLKEKSNYLDRKVIVRHGDGTLSEVQIWTRAMYEAKGAETAAYTAARNLDQDSPEYLAIMARSAEAYSAAIRRDNIDVTSLIPAGMSNSPNLFLKRSANSASDLPPAEALRQTSMASTFTQSVPGSRIDTARSPSPGAVASSVGRYSQDRKSISTDMGGNPSVKDNSSVGTGDIDVNGLRAEFADLDFTLPDGSTFRAADVLDDIEADQTLADVLAVCNPGGQQ